MAQDAKLADYEYFSEWGRSPSSNVSGLSVFLLLNVLFIF
jgi:hypothetical protein